MAERNKIAKPPSLAVRILAIAANDQDRSVLLGDLHEEFVERSIQSQRDAKYWYWRQVLHSAPALIQERMRHSPVFAVAVILLVTVLAFGLITLWDVYIARTVAQFLAKLSLPKPLLAVRLVYFLIQLAGTAAVGALVARFVFFRERPFRFNALTRLLPTALLMIAAAVATWAAAGGNYPASYLVLRVGLSIPALVLGALVASRRSSVR